jgi:AraC-like DNA-binding protein
MNQISDWVFITIFFCTVLGFIMSGVLFFVNRNETFQSKLLAGYLFTMSLMGLNMGLMFTQFYLRFPHMWRITGVVGFFFGPLCYLYVRSVLEQTYAFRRNDILLFIPALLYCISMAPFYFSPAETKLAFVRRVAEDSRLILLEPEGMLPPGWAIWSRLGINMACSIAQAILLYKWKGRILHADDTVAQNRGNFRWLVLLTTVMLLFFLLIIAEFSLHFFHVAELSQLVALTISLTILFISISLLVRPAILYNMKGWLQESEPIPPIFGEEAVTGESQQPGPRRSTLSIAQGKEYKQALERHFDLNKPFLKKGYKINDLSAELNIPYHQLSAFINQEYGKNFNELVNEYRVDHLVEMAKSSPDIQKYTLEALGRQAGFNSRVVFSTAVKKRTGMTPSELFGRKEEVEN